MNVFPSSDVSVPRNLASSSESLELERSGGCSRSGLTKVLGTSDYDSLSAEEQRSQNGWTDRRLRLAPPR
jgi:hypothetical protein